MALIPEMIKAGNIRILPYCEDTLKGQCRSCAFFHAASNQGALHPAVSAHAAPAPSALVYSETVMYDRVSEEDVAVIIDEPLLGDKQVERLKVSAKVLAWQQAAS